MNTPTPRRTLLARGLLLGASTWIGTAACSAPDSPATTLETITPEPTMSPAPTGRPCRGRYWRTSLGPGRTTTMAAAAT